MMEECQSVSKARYSTEKDTVTKQVCEEVHSQGGVQGHSRPGVQARAHRHGERLEAAGLEEMTGALYWPS